MASKPPGHCLLIPFMGILRAHESGEREKRKETGRLADRGSTSFQEGQLHLKPDSPDSNKVAQQIQSFREPFPETMAVGQVKIKASVHCRHGPQP